MVSLQETLIGTKKELNSRLNDEFIFIYESLFKNPMLQLIFSTIHSILITQFKFMNSRLPSNEYGAHFWADNSRELINTFELIKTLKSKLKHTEFSFEIDTYYKEVINNCDKFLEKSGGSTIPPNMEKIDLYYESPIFINQLSHSTISVEKKCNYNLKMIGSGSYATVYKYFDEDYSCYFAVKRANNDLSEKELERFYLEFEELKKFNSKYIVKVYKLIKDSKEYILEYVDESLFDYIRKNNNKLKLNERLKMINHMFAGLDLIHKQGILHRDISPRNVMIKHYDDGFEVKICDFGLVKLPESDLTSIDSEVKGSFNDPSLKIDGFKNYDFKHEIYAITLMCIFILTGKHSNFDAIKDDKIRTILNKGTNIDKSKRYDSLQELWNELKKLNG